MIFSNPNLWIDSEVEELFWGLNNFDNLGSALITIFQVTTLDGWTPMMNFYEDAGSPLLSWVFFITLVVSCNFFILNLTIGQMMLRYEIEMDEQKALDYKANKYDKFD